MRHSLRPIALIACCFAMIVGCGRPVLTENDVPDAQPDAVVADRSITIVRPSGPTAVRGDVQIEVQWTGPAPNNIEIRIDNQSVAQRTTNETVFVWDSRSATEGPHTVVARAFWNDLTLTSPSRTLTVDRTAPRIVTLSPRPGETNAGLHDPIIATFSEPVSATSVATGSVQVRRLNGTLVEQSTTLSEDGLTLTITPVADVIQAPETLQVVLSNSITDAAGNALESMTSPWAWTIPGWRLYGTAVVHPDGVLVAPLLGLDRGDAPLVAARLQRTGQTQTTAVVLSRWDGQNWTWFGSPQTVASNTSRVDHHRLATSAAGTHMLAWEEETTNSSWSSIAVKQWNGESWDAIGPLQNTLPTVGGAFEPDLVCSSTGATYLAWAQGTATGRTIRVRGLVQSLWADLLSGQATVDPMIDARQPVLAVSRRGQVYTAFAREDATGTILDVLRAGATAWEPLERLSPPAQVSNVDEPASMVIDGRDAPVIAWIQRVGTSESTILAARWDGVAWAPVGSPLVSGMDTMGRPTQLQVRADSNNVPWIAWTTGTTIQLMRANGATWTPIRPEVAIPSGSTVESVSFSLTGTDIPVIAYSLRTSSGTSETQVRTLNR